MRYYCQTCETHREGGKIQNGKCIYCGDIIAPATAPIRLTQISPQLRHEMAVVAILSELEKARAKITKQMLNDLGECIYFISDKPGYLVKIGYTTQLGERFFRINQENLGCTLLGAILGTYQDERIIHKMFYQFRQENNSYTNYTEWFYLCKPIRFYIKHFCEMTPTNSHRRSVAI